jgi:thymidine kinase
MVLHFKYKPYQCQFCKEEFTMSRKATAHICDKIEKLPFRCTQCSKRCHSTNQLKNHINTKHIIKVPKKFECDKCPFETKYKQSLIKHFNMHRTFESKLQTKHKIYKCDQCPSLFRSLKAIPVHKKQFHGFKGKK